MAIQFETLMVKLKGDISHLKGELDKAKNEVNKWDKASGQQVRALGGSITKLGQNFSASAQKMGTAISGVGKKMAMLGVAVVGVMALSLREFAKFEKGMANIKILLTDNVESWGVIEDKIRQVAITTGTATADLTKGYFDIQSAVGDVNKSLDIFVASNDLAIAGGSSFAETAKGMVTLMEAYGGSLKDARDGANLLFKAQVFARASIGEMAEATGRFLPLASALGATAEDALASFSTMTVSIGNVNEASTAMSGVLNGLLKPTEALQAKAQEWYGTSIQQAVAEGKLLDILKNLADVEEEELGRMMPRIQGIKGLIAVKKAYAKTLEIATELEDREVEMGEALKIQMATLGQQVAIAKENFADLTREAIAPLVPMVMHFAGTVLPDLINKFKEWKSENEDLFLIILKVIGGGGLLLVGLGLLGIVVGSLVAGIGTLVGGLISVVGIMVTVGGTLYGVTGAFTGLLAGVGGVGIAIALLTPTVKALSMALWDYIKAKKLLEDTKEAPFNRSIEATNKFRVGLEALNKGYDKLTDTEKIHVNAMNEKLDAYDKALVAMNADGELMGREVDLLAELTHGITGAGERKLEYIETLVKERNEIEQQEIAMQKYLESQEKLSDVQKGEANILQMLTLDYKELSSQLIQGEIDQKKYEEGVKGIIKEFKGMGLKIEDITKQLDKVDRADPNIDIKLNILGLQEVTDINRTIRDMNQDIVLESLEGNAKEIQSHKYMLQNKLEDMELLRKERARLAEDNIEMLEIEMQKEIDRSAEILGIKSKEYEKRVTQLTNLYLIDKDFEEKKLEVILGKYDEEQEAFEKLWQIKMDKLNQEKDKKIEVASVSSTGGGGGAVSGGIGGGGAVASAGGEVGSAFYIDPKTGQKVLKTGFTNPTFGGSVQQSAVQSVSTPVREAVQYQVAKVLSSGGSSSGSGSLISRERDKPQSFAVGTSFVPKTGNYKLHKGEEVVTAERARGGGETSITIINKISQDFVDEMISPNTIINTINADIVRNGITRRVIKGVR